MTDIIASSDSAGILVASSDKPTLLIITPVTDMLSQITVVEPTLDDIQESLEIESYDNITVLTPGERGPRGPAGPPGTGSRYSETVSVASTEWIINHNLDRAVSVEVTDLSGSEILCEVVHYPPNQVRVLHTSPQTGVVIVT